MQWRHEARPDGVCGEGILVWELDIEDLSKSEVESDLQNQERRED
jgi:hypothetical protein